MEKKYFRSLEELSIDTSREEAGKTYGDKQFILEMQRQSKEMTSTSRRDFLKAFGFTIASAAIVSSCEQPVRKAIPFLIQPEGLVPGKASYYATTYYDGIDYCSILAKVRDGRPIKIEGNKLSSVTKGGTNARAQASVLNLYDNIRYQEPLAKGEKTDWETVDNQIISQLQAIKEKGGNIVLLTSTIISPSTTAAIAGFLEAYPGAMHIQYDVDSASGILSANEKSFGKAFIPSYHFDKADLIVSFDADFLGTWLSPVEYTADYVKNRKLTDGQHKMSRHIHLEGNMSMTGSNADERIQLRPSLQKAALAGLLNEIGKQHGLEPVQLPELPFDVTALAQELLQNQGKSLVVCGSNDPDSQLIVNAINHLLGSYGQTIDIEVHLKTRKALDAQMNQLLDQMEDGRVDALIVWEVNPVYDLPQNERFTNAFKKIPLSVALQVQYDETSSLASYVCPDHHFLEAWNDFEVKTGHYSVAQPAIRNIFKTRAAQESILKWAGQEVDFRQYMQTYWMKNLYPKSSDAVSFTDFWNKAVHDGIFETKEKETGFGIVAFMSGFNSLQAAYDAASKVSKVEGSDNLELALYYNVSVGTGKNANNPWLQELPDPVTKACWDNYLSVSPKLASELSLKDEMVVTLNGNYTLPVLIQPGQEYKTLGVALGYGRDKAGVPANGVGINCFPLIETVNGNRIFTTGNVSIETKSGKHPIARTQSHHSMEGRSLVRETTLGAYLENPKSGNEVRDEIKKHMKTLYPTAEFDGLHWGMAIDLNACTGCNACVVACSSENNVPVVGKQEVIMAREMHWIRIDRYYKGDADNPEVVRQPVMCQHCDNAPCENVCPVAATTHSNEGLNQMAYNRCIGTRYCANNCPYKVRRFNFFDLTGADSFKGNRYDPAEMTTDLRRMVLNPDVTIRAKGVIEKCSFCVQRIQDKKLDAKKENRMLADGEVVPACAQACPAQAIVFGNLNDKESKISKYFADERNYHLLEEIHTLPSVGYLTKVKNKTV